MAHILVVLEMRRPISHGGIHWNSTAAVSRRDGNGARLPRPSLATFVAAVASNY